MIIEQRGSVRILDSFVSFGLFFLTESDGTLKVCLLCQSSLLLSEALLRCFDGASEFIVVPFRWSTSSLRCCLTCYSSSLFLPVHTRVSSDHAITHGSPVSPLFPKAASIAKKVGDILCLLPHVGTTVLAVLVHILELLERLDDVDVVFKVEHNVLRPSVQEIIENSERLATSQPTTNDGSPKWPTLALNTCLQFFPLSFNRLSSISMISTKSFLCKRFNNTSLVPTTHASQGRGVQ